MSESYEYEQSGVPDPWAVLREHIAGHIAALEGLPPAPANSVTAAVRGASIGAYRRVLADMDELAGEQP
jgi:hypothetical protein